MLCNNLSRYSRQPRWAALAVSATGLAALLVSAGATPAAADPLPYGPETCAPGFSWRQAFGGDTTCVTPSDQPVKQSGNLTFEVTGSGHVYGIVTDPATAVVGDGATAPWSRTITDPGDSLYQVVVTTRDGTQGCRITLNGTVVAEQPIGSNPHCIYTP